MGKIKWVALPAAIGALAWAVATALATPASIPTVSFQAPVNASLGATGRTCDNTGTDVDLSGTLSIGGATVDVRFQNQDQQPTNGQHTSWGSSDAFVTLDFGENGISVPKSTIVGPPGNPYVYLSLDGSTWFYIGRCVQGQKLNNANLSTFINAWVTLATVGALDCSNSFNGTDVLLGGDTGNTGVSVFVGFGKRKGDASSIGNAIAKATLEPAIDVTKNVSLGGAGGDPVITVFFKDKHGNTIGDPNGYLGVSPDDRCVQLTF